MRRLIQRTTTLVGSVLLALALAVAPPVEAQQAPTAESDSLLPLAEEVRTGTLDNGMDFYIRPNSEPADRMQLRLVVNAGSILETDEQQGLAHFLEHMLFNGTENYPEQKLIDFLERTGMEFGPDVNAYTSFDETVYMLQVPTDSTELVENAFTVLRDWASRANLTEEQIDKERGVVVEEWRARQADASGRMQKQTLPKLLYESRYAERLPIGDTSVVRNAPYEEVRSFYRTWYRPDLVSVVAVGDFDPDRIESLIRDRFSDWEAQEAPKERPAYDVPDHEETQFAIATDPEFPVSVVASVFKTDSEPITTLDDYRTNLIESLFFSMLNTRLQEKAQSGEVPFLGAGAFRFNLVRPMKGYGMQAQVQEDSLKAGLEALLTEATRVRQHGFTTSELVRQKRELLRSYETQLAERENTPSRRFASEYVTLALTGEAAPGINYEYQAVQDLLPGISVEEVNDVTATLLADRNRVVLVQMPEKEGLEPPTEEELASILDTVRSKEVEPYTDDMADVPLMAETPEPAEVTSTETVEELGSTKWELANGVTVVHKPTDFKDDEIRFKASSSGGLSVISDEEYPTHRFAASVVNRSGVGPFDRASLNKYLKGKTVSVSPYINDLEEGLNGSASPEDLETLFQLIHLYVTEPRIDDDALSSFQQQQVAALKNRSNTPGAAFQDSLTAHVYDNHPRRSTPTVEDVESLQAAPLLDFYRARFQNASDFTFTFSGNVSTDSLAQFVTRYLGTLPQGEGPEEAREVMPTPPNEVVRTEVKAGMGQRSTVLLSYNGPMDYTRENRHRLKSLSDVLSIKLREELRENRSGTYGVQVRDNTTGAPMNRYSFTVVFLCEPARAQELLDAAKAEIDSVRNGHVDAEDVAKVKEQQTRSRETALETNSFWVSALNTVYTTPGVEPLDVNRYDELVEQVTPESVTQTATEYLHEDRYILGILYPEGFEASEASPDDGNASGSGR